jgi:hypothetical protein
MQEADLPLYQQIYRRFLHRKHGTLVPDAGVGLQRVCSSKYAFMTLNIAITEELLAERCSCQLASLPTSYFRSSLSLGLALNSPYKAFINYQ